MKYCFTIQLKGGEGTHLLCCLASTMLSWGIKHLPLFTSADWVTYLAFWGVLTKVEIKEARWPPKSNIRSCHAFTHAPKGFLCLLLGLNCATISNHFHLPQAHTILSPSYLSQQVAWAPRLTNTEVFGHKLYATFSLSFYFLSLVKKSSFFLPRGIESRCFAQSCSSFSPTYKTDQ